MLGSTVAAVETRGLTCTRRFGAHDVAVLAGVDLEVKAHEFVAVVGDPGAGTSTLLACCAGVESYDGGEVRLWGRDLAGLTPDERAHERATSMGFVFQRGDLLDDLTVRENVEWPLRLGGLRSRAARLRAQAALERFERADLADRRIPELPEADRQLAALARALVNTPRSLWADEPTARLDPDGADAVARLLAALTREGTTVVLVTHDTRAARYADRVLELRAGRVVPPGRTGQAGAAGWTPAAAG